jgi:hypothetical protein
MTLCYKIDPEVNLILYIGEGNLKPSDFYAAEKAAFAYHRREPGMITLVDALDVSTSFDMDDVHTYLEHVTNIKKNGTEPGPYIMITRDTGIHLMAQAVNLMTNILEFKIRVFHSLRDAIADLGLSDEEAGISKLWNECRSELERVQGRGKVGESSRDRGKGIMDSG